MHIDPVFHNRSAQENQAFAAKRGFGSLIVNGPEGPLAAHVPFLVTQGAITLHLFRANPLCRAGADLAALLIVAGPDGYVSPDWYDLDDQVPTWNYVALHIRGILSPLPEDQLEAHLAELSARFEAELLPKKPWTLDKMSEAKRTRMLRMILPYRMTISSVDGAWKLGQDKPEAQRLSVARRLAACGNQALADLMAPGKGA